MDTGSLRRAPDGPPLRLLPVVPWFTDRDDALADLRAAVTAEPDRTAVVVSGPVGVGKTALATKLCRELVPAFPDGVCHLDLVAEGCLRDGTVGWPDVVDTMLAFLGHRPTEFGSYFDRVGVLHQTFAASRALIVLDGVPLEPELARLLPPTGPSAVLAISRDPIHRSPELLARGVQAYRLAELPPAQRRVLVRRFAAAGGADVDPPEDHDWAGYGRDGLHGLIRGLAVRVAARPRVLPSDDPPVPSDPGTGGHADAAATRDPIGSLVAGTSGARRELLAVLLAHPGPWLGAEVVPEAQRPILANLARSGVLADLGADRYAFAELDPDSRLRALRDNGFVDDAAVLEPVAHRYLSLAYAADVAVLGPDRLRLPGLPARAGGTEPGWRAADALAWLERQRPNLEALVRLLYEAGRHELVGDLCETLWALYTKRPGFAGATDTYRLGVRSAVAAGSRWAEVKLRAELARAVQETGDHAGAHEQLRQCRRLADTVGDWSLRAMVAEVTGRQYLAERQYPTAMRHYAEARAAYREHRHRRGESLVLRSMALCLARSGAAGAAVEHAREAVRLAEELGEPGWRGRALLALAEVQYACGDPGAARHTAGEAIEVFADRREWVLLARGAELAARIARDTGDPAGEVRALRQAIDAHRSAGNPLIRSLVDRLASLAA